MDSTQWKSGRRVEMMMGNGGEEGGGGGGGVEACEDCTQKCMMLHGRKGPSPSVASFFKIMFGDAFHSVLFIPPKFSQTIMSLVEQKVFLDDSNGNSWSVKVSMVDGRLAFKQGWNRFVSDHSIEIGDFVVFNYLIESHFIVQIYGKSGCEKVNFSKGSNINKAKQVDPKYGLVLKRSELQLLKSTAAPFRTNDAVSDNRESCSTAHFNSDQEIFHSKGSTQDMEEVPVTKREVPKCDKNKSVPRFVSSEDCTELPFYMINRNAEHEETFRNSFFDLSNFEMVEGKNGVKGPEAVGDKKAPDSNVKSVQSKSSLGTNCLEGRRGIILEEPAGKRRASVGAPLDVLEFEEPGRKFQSENADKIPNKVSGHGPPTSQLAQNTPTRRHKTEIDNPPGTSKTASGTSLLTKEEHCLYSGKVETQLQSPTRNASLGKSIGSVQQIITKKYVSKKDSMIKAKNYPYEKKLKICKEEPVEHVNEEPAKKGYPNVIAKGNTYRVVKSEAVDVVDFSISVCVVSESYLELGELVDFPSFSCRGRPRTETKILLLRDPQFREWPVLLHEKHGLRVLTIGWEALSKANAIRKGDTCILNLEDESECLFEVQISRSKGF